MRLNKHISDTGYCSRREADRLIGEGRVTVNGQRGRVGSEVGEGDEVRIDGEILRARTADWPDTIVVAQANAGPSPASNAGLARATGDYVKFVDGDDVLAPDATQRLLDLLQRHGADLAYGGGGHYAIGEPLPAPKPTGDGALMDSALRFVLTAPPFNLSQILVTRAACDRARGFDERIFVQDYPFLLRLAAVGRFVGTRETVCYFPKQQGGRLTDNHANMLFHANLSAWMFCREHDLAPDLLQLAASRAVGRAWLYAKRHRGKSLFSREFAAFLSDRLSPARSRDTALGRMRASFPAFGDEPMRRYAALLDQSAASR